MAVTGMGGEPAEGVVIPVAAARQQKAALDWIGRFGRFVADDEGLVARLLCPAVGGARLVGQGRQRHTGAQDPTTHDKTTHDITSQKGRLVRHCSKFTSPWSQISGLATN